MTRTVAIASALSLFAAGIAIKPPSAAAAQQLHGYVGQHQSSVAGCPFLIWRLVTHDDGSITGMVYYSDMSGVSMANGAMNQEGQFHLQLTSEMGNGPVATIDGVKPRKGKATATMKGAGCANMEITMDPVENLNKIPTGSQLTYKGG